LNESNKEKWGGEMKKTCYLCGYTDYTGTNFTTWKNHKVHMSCLQSRIVSEKKDLEFFKKISIGGIK